MYIPKKEIHMEVIGKHFGKKRGTVGRRKVEKITLIKYIICTCVDVMMKYII